MPTELRPLYGERSGPLIAGISRPSYAATAVADINNANQVVGISWGPSSSVLPFARPAPFKKATLWDGGGNPTAIDSGPNSSEALSINDAGSILYYVSDAPERDYPRRYFVGPVGGAVALDELIEAEAISAIDLNDNGVVLGQLGYQVAAQMFLYDLASGTLTVLPPLGDRASSPVGVDNAGRVLAAVTDPTDNFSVSLHYLPAGGEQWTATGLVTPFVPRLSKTGLVLATLPQRNLQDPAFPDWLAGYYDLNAAAPAYTSLPRVAPAFAPNYPGHYTGWAADANAAGLIVGQLLNPGISATLYRPSSGVNTDLTPLFTPATWAASNARGVNNAGAIIGNGTIHTYTPQVQYRGWILNPDRDERQRDANRRFSEFVRILIGITGGGGGIVLPPGGGPNPIDPEGPMSLLDTLTPERKDVITGMLLAHLGGGLHDPEMRRVLVGVERRLVQKALDRLSEIT